MADASPVGQDGAMIEGLVPHLEQYLGPIEMGWVPEDGEELPFQVVSHVQTVETTAIASTLGLSEYELPHEHGDDAAHPRHAEEVDAEDSLRLELFMMVPDDVDAGPIVSTLVGVGALMIEERIALHAGMVVTGVDTLAGVSPHQSLYVSRPLFYTPEFQNFTAGDVEVEIDWLIPIADEEADYIDREGWQAFERLMYEVDDFDPIDITRASIV
jgi:hypothetical protein